MMANSAEAIKGMARCPTRSESAATPMVVMKAKAYGGMVRSWALAAVYPRSLMIVGCSKPCQSSRFLGSSSAENTYQEQRKRVERQTHGVEAESVEPALGITQGLDNVGPGEPLVAGGITVRGQAPADEAALLVGEELGRLGVVVDEPIRSNGNQDGGYPFLRFS